MKYEEYQIMKDIVYASNGNVELKYNPDLHAKIILNEESALVSSMNLYESSKDNFEAGILFPKNNDSEYTSVPKVFEDLKKFCESIWKHENTEPYAQNVRYVKFACAESNYTMLKTLSKILHKNRNVMLNDMIACCYTSGSFKLNEEDDTEMLCEQGIFQKAKDLYKANQDLKIQIDELRERLSKYEPID